MELKNVRDLMDSSDAFCDNERHEVTEESLRRLFRDALATVSDAALAAAADELFVALDAREAESGRS